MRPTLVLMASASIYVDRGVSLAEWQAGTRATLRGLTEGGVRVAVMRDNPKPALDIPTCLARAARQSWGPDGCSPRRAAAVRTSVYEAEVAAARNLPNVHFIDMTDELCGADVCPVLRDGAVVYRDDNHLTGGFAESLMPALRLRLEPLVGFR